MFRLSHPLTMDPRRILVRQVRRLVLHASPLMQTAQAGFFTGRSGQDAGCEPDQPHMRPLFCSFNQPISGWK